MVPNRAKHHISENMCFRLSLLHYLVPISVRLKSKRQRINTVTFYLRDTSTPLVAVVFKHIDKIQEPLIYKCWSDVISALQWLFWLRSALSRLLMFLNRIVHVFVFTKLPSSRFIFDLLLPHFDLSISCDLLIFLLWYLASLDNASGCSQLSWPWDFKQCSVAILNNGSHVSSTKKLHTRQIIKGKFLQTILNFESQFWVSI